MLLNSAAKLRADILILALLASLFASLNKTLAQQFTSQGPFNRIEGKYIDIVTDLSVDDETLKSELRELVDVFEAAMPIWCNVFEVRQAQISDWKCTAYIMLDRGRFEAAGHIPAQLPKFPYGYQFGDRVWVAEQPSAYYRRHLLLHEGTHWFMNRKYGNNGPPWLMEGMAEWLGTHRWDRNTRQLEMGVLPATKDEVPYWGRVSLLRKQLASGLAPSLESVMRYGSSAHQQVDAYAWSWAAVVFLQSHPRTQETFQKMLKRPMRPDRTLTRWLFTQLRAQWPAMRTEWRSMLTDIDYGYDPSKGMLALTRDLKPVGRTEQAVTVAADKAWQPSGLQVTQGQSIRIEAHGQFIVGKQPSDWVSFPDGVTLEYYEGVPLGKLVMRVVSPMKEEPDFSNPLQTYEVGSRAKIPMRETGELHFKINERSSNLDDNSGVITVRIVEE